MKGKSYTADEVAKILNISRYTVYEMVKRGDLLGFKIGNKVRVEEKALMKYIHKGKNENLESNHTISQMPTIRITGGMEGILERLVVHATTNGLCDNIRYFTSSTFDSLVLLFKNQVDMAVLNLHHLSLNDSNLHFIKELMPIRKVSLIRLATSEHGFIVPKGNPFKIKKIKDLTQKGTVFVNLIKGSTTRIIFDQLLDLHSVHPHMITGYETEEITRLSAVTRVVSGHANVSFGTRYSASCLNLDFVPVCKEHIDLAISWDSDKGPYLKKLLKVFNSDEARKQLETLDGYDFSDFGKVIYERRS